MSRVHVVILAGGKGTRLWPYTASTPKALLPMGEDCVLGLLLRQLESFGFPRVTLAVGHLAEAIEAFVARQRYSFELFVSRESRPLGTIGPLALLTERLADASCILTINADVLTDIDFRKVVLFHLRQGPAATLVARRIEVSIPYGVVEIDSASNLTRFSEKPSWKIEVSTGINVFSPRSLEVIEIGKSCDVPVLMARLRFAGERISAWRGSFLWADVGTPEAYLEAQRLFTRARAIEIAR